MALVKPHSPSQSPQPRLSGRQVAGGVFHYTSMETPVGTLIFISSQKALQCLHISSVSVQSYLMGNYPKSSFCEDQNLFGSLKEWFNAYFKGVRVPFSGEIFFKHGSPFQQRVWKTLMEIPFGEVRSYQWVGERVGTPKAPRAVGQANGKNPFPILVPCHRIIYQDGTLGGYSGGIGIKKRLLELEGWRVHQNRVIRRDFQ